MGTWGAPQTKQERAELKAKLKQLKTLQDELLCLFGDDILADAFAAAEGRLKYAAKTKWTKVDHRTDNCKHPAFYGSTPGVCRLCRLNPIVEI